MTELHQRGDAGPMAVVRARLNQQVDKVVVGQSHVVDATMIAIAQAMSRALLRNTVASP